MAGGGASSNASRQRKRVEAESAPSSATALKRARDGSAFTKCEGCSKDVAVALISFHDCSLDAKIKINLEAQVVEMASETKKKPAGERKKSKQTDSKAKKEKKAKNPNGKKRSPTAFFLFMDDFRKSFKETNPDCKSVATVAKEGGEKWKSMSDEDKKVYIDRAAELKAEYEKSLESNNNAESDNDQDIDVSSEKEVKEEADELSDDVTVKEERDISEHEVKEEAEEDDE